MHKLRRQNQAQPISRGQFCCWLLTGWTHTSIGKPQAPINLAGNPWLSLMVRMDKPSSPLSNPVSICSGEPAMVHAPRESQSCNRMVNYCCKTRPGRGKGTITKRQQAMSRSQHLPSCAVFSLDLKWPAKPHCETLFLSSKASELQELLGNHQDFLHLLSEEQAVIFGSQYLVSQRRVH